MMCQTNTKIFIMFIIVLGQHVSILVESFLGPSKKIDPYLEMFKMRCGIPNLYILDKTIYKMHVSLCSYCTIRIPISKTLAGICERGYTYAFEMCCFRMLDIVIYFVANYKICI
jgi:hypothetical protein